MTENTHFHLDNLALAVERLQRLAGHHRDRGVPAAAVGHAAAEARAAHRGLCEELLGEQPHNDRQRDLLEAEQLEFDFSEPER